MISHTEALLPEDLLVKVKNQTSDILCNASLCETSNGTKLVGNRETCLERSLGFLVIGIIGVVANAFVILILGSSAKIRQKLVNTLIIHQSFVDLLASIVLIGTAHIDGADQHGLEGIHAEVYCFFLMGKWPLWVMLNVSSVSLMFLNIERYISIIYPIYHRTKTTRKKVLMLLPMVWVLTMLEISSFSMSYGSKNGACVFDAPEMFYFMASTFLIFHFLLPVILVFCLYGHMFLTLRSAVNSGSNTASSNGNDVMEKAKNNVFKTMFFITICYAICYVSNSVYLFLIIIGILDNLSGKYLLLATI